MDHSIAEEVMCDQYTGRRNILAGYELIQASDHVTTAHYLSKRKFHQLIVVRIFDKARRTCENNE